MKLTRLAGSWVWVAVPVAAFLAGCDGGPDTRGTAEDTQIATAELVGSVQLSATHDVTFWDYGNGMARIEENLHADQDRGATLTLDKVDIEGRTLSNIYEIFAGADADPAVLERLRALDLRVAAAAVATSTPALPHSVPANQQGTAFGLAPPPAAALPGTPSAPDSGLEVRRGAVVCVEPNGFDWQADGQWFADNFCNGDSNPVYSCGWAESSISEEWTERLSYYHSSGINQSFCTGAGYLVKYRIFTGGKTLYASSLISGTIPIRWVRNDAWTASGDSNFMSMIWSTTGSTTVGLTLHEKRS